MNETIQEQDYKHHWDLKFRSRSWGRYPPEDLVRFVCRSYPQGDRSSIHALEVGCGPGANVWFLHREGFAVAGIDGSVYAIERAGQRIEAENIHSHAPHPELKLGDFSTLPWREETFDFAIDIFSIYANPVSVMRLAIDEIYRVLKPGGMFYSKLWGQATTGCGHGTEIEPGTYTDIPFGPCANMGVSHFVNREEIAILFSRFDVVAIDVVQRTDTKSNSSIQEFLCHFVKTGK